MKRKNIGLGFIFGAVVPLAVVSTAWACGILATLKLNTKTVSPNQVVTATGNNYSGSGPVSIHLKSRTGAVLASTSPDPASRIATSLTIPANTRPGYYVLIATEYKADGTPVAGTPGRTVIRVLGSGSAAHRAAVAVSPWGSSTPTGPAGSTAPSARADGSSSQATLPMLLAVALSMTLLASGVKLAGRRPRAATAPQLGL